MLPHDDYLGPVFNFSDHTALCLCSAQGLGTKTTWLGLGKHHSLA